MLYLCFVLTMALVPETTAPRNNISSASGSFGDEKDAGLSLSPSALLGRSYSADSVYLSGAHNRRASSLTTLVEAGLSIPLSARPASSGSLHHSENEPRPRHINDVVREKLDKARNYAARSNAIPSAELRSDSSKIDAPRGRTTVAQCRQEEDGGVRLAGGALGELTRSGDASDRIPPMIVHEDDTWSIRRPSIVTLPPPYTER